MEFSNGRLVHCPWCDLPLNPANLGPATNLQGQLSRGNKPPKLTVPSLAIPEGTKVNLQDYDARALCEAVAKQNPHAMRFFKRGRFANDVGDESTATGNTTTSGNISSQNSQLSTQEEEEIIMANAANVQTGIENTAKKWAGTSPKDRLIAASACPKALYAELGDQLAKANEALAEMEELDMACKAKAKKNNANATPPKPKPTESETSTPSMWKWGTGNPKRPSSLCVPAASVLMGILYGARMARYDLIRPVRMGQRL